MAILLPFSRGGRLRPGCRESKSGVAIARSTARAPDSAIFANSAAISVGVSGGSASLKRLALRACPGDYCSQAVIACHQAVIGVLVGDLIRG